MKKMALALAAILAFGVTSGLSNDLKRWYFKRTGEGRPPMEESGLDLAKYSAYFLGNIEQQELYLTFDEGYENGYTEVILDILAEKQVSAAFFVTETYIRSNPELIQRMVEEGHVVGNHTVKHKSSPSLSEAEMKDELEKTAQTYRELTGQDMPPFFRPPMGQYSEQVLAICQEAGYSTVFWSFAYEDWHPDKQPGRKVAFERVMKGLHNGAILLLHAVSKSNTEALSDIIDEARARGYEFKSLYELTNSDG